MSEAASAAATPATPATTAVTPAATPAAVATPVVEAPKTAETPKVGAPEKYDFKTPDGVTLNQQALTQFADLAKSHGLSQEQAQALVDFQSNFVKSEIAAYEKQMKEEEAQRPAKIMEAIAKDPELGGPNAVANAATMQRAVEAFGGAEFKKFLDAQPVEAHLAFARFALKVGKAIREDSRAGAAGTTAAEPKRGADILFGEKKAS